jgi:hypothetical protein
MLEIINIAHILIYSSCLGGSGGFWQTTVGKRERLQALYLLKSRFGKICQSSASLDRQRLGGSMMTKLHLPKQEATYRGKALYKAQCIELAMRASELVHRGWVSALE